MSGCLLDLSALQPTDILRVESQSHFDRLNIHEIEKRYGIPQVWVVDNIPIISDGNQRAANYAKRGVKEIRVDKQTTDIPDYFLDYLNLVVSRAEVFRRQGILSPHDLWR
jgi:hypothetical protein